jgi:hypothetical protein
MSFWSMLQFYGIFYFLWVLLKHPIEKNSQQENLQSWVCHKKVRENKDRIFLFKMGIQKRMRLKILRSKMMLNIIHLHNQTHFFGETHFKICPFFYRFVCHLLHWLLLLLQLFLTFSLKFFICCRGKEEEQTSVSTNLVQYIKSLDFTDGMPSDSKPLLKQIESISKPLSGKLFKKNIKIIPANSLAFISFVLF